ncbi:MAG: DUF2145 domain-containing protein [Magnetococcus sp. DMHC-8]
MPPFRPVLVLLLLSCLVAGQLLAGEKARFEPGQIRLLADKVEKILTDRAVQVAILARMGRPRSELPEGMHFTHASFVVRAAGRGSGYAVYNLYQKKDQPDTSELVQDFPVDFFATVAELEAGIIIPSTALQTRLLAVIDSPTYPALHDPRYSLIANPYTLGRQNCTEFVLDVLQAARHQTGDLDRIKASEKAEFVAQPVHVNRLKLILAALFSAEVSLADQPGPPVTATFERIGAFLLERDAGSAMLTVLP